MSLSRTGDWKIVMHADGVDSEGKNTYQHIYQHKDGRKAYVGPGYCSDPDLEWILFKRNRENKLAFSSKIPNDKARAIIDSIILLHRDVFT